MKGWLPVFKKELLRFFKDRRMVLGVLILPGLLIYLVYSFMGEGLSGLMGNGEHTPTAYVQNMPEGWGETVFGEQILAETVTEEGAEAAKTAVKNGERDLFIVFPENFKIEKPQEGEPIPNIAIYYNAAETNSSAAYTLMSTILNELEFFGENKYDINNPEAGIQYNLASDKDMSSMIFSMIMPLLIMIFVFSGAMSVAPESIAGEKERGTFATLLVTPVSRAGVAIGKIAALSIISVLCGLSSFAGIILSLPKMIGTDMNTAIYAAGDYLALFGVVISTVLLAVALISVISAFAKSVKEATAYVTPLMILNMLLSITCMFGDGAPTNPFLYLIPLYNSVQSLHAVFSFSVVPLNLVIAVISNIVYTLALVFLLTWMFKNEKIMFRK